MESNKIDTIGILKFLQGINSAKTLSKESSIFLLTADIDPFYTNVTLENAQTSIKKILAKNNHDRKEVQFVIQALKILFEYNNFTYGSDHYIQTKGMSMGTRCSPSVCGLTFSVFEEEFLKKYNSHKHWARHIDDIFSVFTGTKRQLQYSLYVLNSSSEEFKVKFEVSKSKVDFLDMTISLDHNKILQTDIFRAPAKIAVYVHWKSGHPISTNKSIIKSACIIFRRVCSSVEKYNKACAELCKTLMNRDYPHIIINTIINEVRCMDRDQLLERRVREDSDTSQPPRAAILYIPEVSNQLRNIMNNHWD